MTEPKTTERKTRERTWLALIALLGAMAVFAASCGSDDETETGDSDGTEEPSTEEPDGDEADDSADSDDESSDETEGEGENEGDATTEGDPIAIGMIGDLTGPTSDVGVSYAEGQRAYVDFVNANGGVGGREIELLWQDYQYDVAIAEQLYSQFVSEGAVAFMGWGTGDTEALRERITTDQIPFMSASLAETLIDPGETPYNFVPATTYSEQMRVALRYIADQGDAASVAVFHHDSPFGTSPLADGETYIADNDLDLTFEAIPMPGGVTDYVGQITQAGDVDYIIIQNVPSPAATLVRDLRTAGNDATVICLNWCGNEVLVELAGGDAEGVLSVQPFLGVDSGVEGLEDIVAAAGGEDNVSIGFIHGWTAMRTMVTAVETVVTSGDDVTGEAIAAALESQTISTGGLSADIVFSPDSHAGMTGAPIQVVTDGAWQPLEDVIVP